MRRTGGRQVPAGPLTVAVVTALVLGVALAAVIVSGRMPPGTFAWAGPQGPSYPLVFEDFHGEGAAATTGYDAQQYYAVAATFPHLSEAEPYLDHPRYRVMRILAPAIASLAPRGAGIVLVLLALDVVGAAVAAGAVADLARRLGRPPALGYAAAVAALPAVVLNTPDALGFGLALLGVALAVRRRVAWAVLALCLAALTRESTIVVSSCVGLVALVRAPRRPRTYLPFAIPGVVVAAWFVVLGLVVSPSEGDLLEVLGLRHLRGGDLAVAMVGLAVGAAGAVAWRAIPELAAVSVAFTAWMLIELPVMLTWDASPRVNYPAWAVGLAGLAWAATSLARGRGSAPPASRPVTG